MAVSSPIFFGALQGLTEFLPVSSSGHLLLFRHLLVGYDSVLTLDIFFHAGSLVAILLFFRSQIRDYFSQLLKPLMITTLPAVIVGLPVYLYFSSIFSSPRLLAVTFLITSLLLLLLPFISPGKTKLDKVSPAQALIVGLFQALAILPGVSRSGSTIVSGRLSGLDNQSSFQYAFISAIPAILAALVLALRGSTDLSPQILQVGLIGFTTSLLVSLLALKILKNLVVFQRLHLFASYTFLLATLSLALFY